MKALRKSPPSVSGAQSAPGVDTPDVGRAAGQNSGIQGQKTGGSGQAMRMQGNMGNAAVLDMMRNQRVGAPATESVGAEEEEQEQQSESESEQGSGQAGALPPNGPNAPVDPADGDEGAVPRAEVETDAETKKPPKEEEDAEGETEAESDANKGVGAAGGMPAATPEADPKAKETTNAVGQAGGEQGEGGEISLADVEMSESESDEMQLEPAMSIPSGGDSDVVTGELWSAWTGSSLGEQDAQNAQAVGTIAARGVALNGKVTEHAQSLVVRGEGNLEQLVAQVRAGVEQAQAQVRTGFAAARARIDAAAQATLSQIETSAVGALAAVDAAEATQTAALNAGFDAEQDRLTLVADTAVASMSTAFEGKVGEIRGLGPAAAASARTTAARQSSAYRARGGEGIDGERNVARADAAKAVGESYAKSLTERANQAASEISAGVANIPGMVSGAVDPVATALADQRAQMLDMLAQTAEGARGEIETQRMSAIDMASEAQSSATTQITAQETSALARIGTAGDTIEAGLREASAQGGIALEANAAELRNSIATDITSLQEGFLATDHPLSADVQAAVADAMLVLESRDAEITSTLDQASDALFTQLSERASDGIARLNADAATLCEGVSESAGGAEGALAELAASVADGFAGLGEATGTALADVTTQGLDAARGAVDQTAAALAQNQATIVGELATVKNGVKADLDSGLAKLPGDISVEAEKAADKIQPLWKKVLATVVSIVVAVVVFVAVAAFVIATFGTGLIVAGIIAGAVAGVAALLAKDATLSLLTWSNQFSSPKDYVAAFIMGGVGGGLGMWTAGFSNLWIGAAVAGFGESVIDQVVDMTLYSEPFNIGELLIGGVVMTLTAGLLGRFVNESLDASFLKRVFPGPNSWNAFQREMVNIPGLRGLTATARATLYAVVKQMSSKTLGDVVKEVESQVGILNDSDKK